MRWGEDGGGRDQGLRMEGFSDVEVPVGAWGFSILGLREGDFGGVLVLVVR